MAGISTTRRIESESPALGAQVRLYREANNVNEVTFGSEAGWHRTTGPVWDQQKRLVDKIVTTELGDLPNVIWEVCTERHRHVFYRLEL
jgi:hypothetical protein